ncbi:MAG: DUF72 domain-containing protein, partial [Mucilaginibacter sp.]|nr:DUF72 domain-containing protein [Mucilaginibacter sp.]
MEFGHVYESLNTVDFTLPPDGEFTAQALSNETKAGALNIYIGAPKWGQKSWKGLIYPKLALDKELLGFYSQNFNAVEFGPTFYLIYSEDEISK